MNTFKTVLVTGGAGFIGSNFVHLLLRERPQWNVIVLDKLTYAGNLKNLQGLDQEFPDRFKFVKGCITDAKLTRELCANTNAIVHFAAESHVDRSILDPDAFVQTNVAGTLTLLTSANAFPERKIRFVQVSTDEVYGTLGDTGAFTEETPLAPNSPYSASKAGADFQVPLRAQ